MGYAYYEFEDGHGPRGYAVDAICAAEGCVNEIDKGLAYLCYGCTNYFCGVHLTVGFGKDGNTMIQFDCFAGESSQCCHKCEAEAEQTWEESK